MMNMVYAAGWILAAFLAGILAAGAYAARRTPPVRRARPAHTAPGARGRKSRKKAALAPAYGAPEERAPAYAAEKAQREWRNFLDYDGTAQTPAE